MKTTDKFALPKETWGKFISLCAVNHEKSHYLTIDDQFLKFMVDTLLKCIWLRNEQNHCRAL